MKLIHDQAITEKKIPPYIEEEFNVIPLFKNAAETKSTVARIYNAVIAGIEDNERLPKYIVVMPDHDVIKYGDEYGADAPVALYTLLKFLVKNINRIVDAHFEAIYKKKPSAIKAGEPHIIWIKTLD